MIGLELACAVFGIGLYIAYYIGFRKGTATSAHATMIIMREFLNHSQGSDWTDITLGKNMNRVHRWMDRLEDGEEEES
jgi:hypothetical protein